MRLRGGCGGGSAERREEGSHWPERRVLGRGPGILGVFLPPSCFSPKRNKTKTIFSKKRNRIWTEKLHKTHGFDDFFFVLDFPNFEKPIFCQFPLIFFHFLSFFHFLQFFIFVLSLLPFCFFFFVLFIFLVIL